MAFFNELQIRRDSTKIKNSLNSLKRQGKFMGGTPPYGYVKNPHNKYELLVDEEQAYIIKKIFTMCISGMGSQKIANILTEEKIPIPSVQKNLHRGIKTNLYGIWHSKTVRDILKNEDYIGNLTQCKEEKINCKIRKKTPKDKWLIIKNACPAIIDKKTFELAQSMFLKNKNQNNKSQNYLLRKFLICKECGHTISINKYCWTKKGEKITKYLCYCNYYKKYPKQNVCTPHKFDYHELEQNILNEIKKLFKEHLKSDNLEKIIRKNDYTIQLLDDLKKSINHYKNNIETNENCIDKCYNQNLKGLIDDHTFQRQYNLLKEQNKKTSLIINELEQKANKINKKISIQENNYKLIISKFLSMKTPSKQLLSLLINKIEIDKNLKINIYYNFKSLY